MRQCDCEHRWEAFTLRKRGNLIRPGLSSVMVCSSCNVVVWSNKVSEYNNLEAECARLREAIDGPVDQWSRRTYAAEAECTRQAGLLEDGTKGMAILAKEIADLRGLEVTVARYKAALEAILDLQTEPNGAPPPSKREQAEVWRIGTTALEPTAEKA